MAEGDFITLPDDCNGKQLRTSIQSLQFLQTAWYVISNRYCRLLKISFIPSFMTIQIPKLYGGANIWILKNTLQNHQKGNYNADKQNRKFWPITLIADNFLSLCSHFQMAFNKIVLNPSLDLQEIFHSLGSESINSNCKCKPVNNSSNSQIWVLSKSVYEVPAYKNSGSVSTAA